MREFHDIQSGATLRYHDLPGDQTPIVFIHGLGCASSLDYPQVAAARGLERHRCILIDMLGSGFSDHPDTFSYTIDAHAALLARFIQDLALGGFFLFGHSMGGAVATNVATRLEGQGLRGLILSEANLDAGGGFFSQQIAAYSEADYLQVGHARLIQSSRAEGNGNWAAGLATSAPLAIHRVAQSLIAGQLPSWRERLYALSVSKTYLFGEHSLPDPDKAILDAAAIDIGIVPDAGHSMAWENPQGVADALLTAIQRADCKPQ
ncbi:alpha/beta fold hydrolase [Vibrio coralliilyticus]|uniref:alpha/beta fold hydrolase n=1 Tax=Vibrio coralliilyticus TaxID=190893 RepID=UPI000BAACFD6|nr:alpha/beta hydrolase [Vibrio coralliilyticus]NOI58991.1 alpha/beta hydrolase [Vibrio coralliilyticus]PAT66763.1 alpha/beta hydrolase [Vibrio coralliilyticus]